MRRFFRNFDFVAPAYPLLERQLWRRAVKANPLHRMVDWLRYRFDRIFSGIEADRQYDPLAHIDACGWLMEGERQFCGGSVSAQVLMKALEPVTASFRPRTDVGRLLRFHEQTTRSSFDIL